jgi:uncharacterized membrane protein
MAGIGFELRKILKKDSLFSLVQLYTYSAMLSSGAWVVSIIAILIVGLINIAVYGGNKETIQLQIIITYAFAMAASLVLTGFIQLPLTRYIADLVFAQREDEVLGSFLGVLFVILGIGISLFIPMVFVLLPELSNIEKILVTVIFLTLSAIWVSNVLASSLKYYRSIVAAYFVSYGVIVVASYYYGSQLVNLLFIFFAGNVLLLTIMITMIYKSYPSDKLMRFDFFQDRDFYFKLGFAGLFYNLGTWIDKFVFWYHPLTGESVIGMIHSSIVYDLPIFLAYLSIIPGMAIFFYRLEADFAEQYDHFYNNIRYGGTLSVIQTYRNQMVDVIRVTIKEVILIQAVVDIMIFLAAPYIFEMLKIPKLYMNLFFILTIGAMLQLGFMIILAILYYLDRRTKAMWLSFLFFVLNFGLTWLSIYMGPTYFGYGYAVSLLITFTISLYIIRQTMQRLDYETFMLQ